MFTSIGNFSRPANIKAIGGRHLTLKFVNIYLPISMKRIFIFMALATALVCISQAAAQKSDDVLATATGVTITPASLSAEAKRAYEGMSSTIAASRSRALSSFLADLLFETEAASRRVTVEALETEVKAAVPGPSAVAIRSVYDANRSALGDRPLEEVRSRIVAFLRSEPEQKALQDMVRSLQQKHSLSMGKDVNAPDLKPADVVARIGPRAITAGEFENEKRFELHDAKAHIYEDVRTEIELTLLSALLDIEAKERKTDASGVIAAEVTNRMRDFSDEERIDLEYGLEKRLFAKYNAKILITEPPPLIVKVSTDDDPSLGPADAPVTIVMFSDFQCPACAAAHPALKRVIAEYPGKIRLVVRDYPLESIHENAFGAALAANAANAQGKFWDYIELLYRDQDSLDTQSLRSFAERTGLDLKKFDSNMADPAAAAEIRKDRSDGDSYGVVGTPTIFINGVKVHRLSAPGFRHAIERALGK